jgi:diaminohydroxyphosphoribosylaminopyrimidine deaminase/5-amino-6-(5-phosphoribosylamino)uracil reductase
MKLDTEQVISPAHAMQLAINEALKGTGRVSPNPLVGCTIVDRNHRLLALGAHLKVGSDHAEINALKQINDKTLLEGAHLYVTLEPCAHQGRTPSCAQTLAQYKLGSVTYAVEDPNPLVSGQGGAILQAAGVKVQRLNRTESPELINSAERLAEIFLHNMRAKEPFVAIKVASTLDGRMAMTSGESKWITGERARNHGHYLRAQYDAVAIGRNTFVSDDPSLNVRDARFADLENKVVLFDPKGKTLDALASSNLLKVRRPEYVFVVVEKNQQTIELIANAPSGVRILPFEIDASGLFSMTKVLEGLRAEGIHSLMIEGGAHLFGAFFSTRKAQRLHLFQAPSLIGSRHSIAWSAAFGVQEMVDKIHIEEIEREIMGDDLYLTGRLRYSTNLLA